MLTLHILAALFSFGIVWKADKQALSWIRGTQPVLSVQRMRRYHILTWSGLLALVSSGAALSYPMLRYLLAEPVFIMKLLFVAVLLVNAVLIGRLIAIATTKTFASLSWNERLPLLVSGAVSSVSWLGALVLALILFS